MTSWRAGEKAKWDWFDIDKRYMKKYGIKNREEYEKLSLEGNSLEYFVHDNYYDIWKSNYLWTKLCIKILYFIRDNYPHIMFEWRFKNGD